MTTVKSTPESENYDGRIAASFGLFTELQLRTDVSFRFGVEYGGFGGKKNGMQAMPLQRLLTEIGNSVGMGITEQHLAALGGLMYTLPDYYYVNVDNTAKIDYVTIPLLMQVGRSIGQTQWYAYINAGPTISLILSGKQATKGTSKMYTDYAGGTTLWEFVEQLPSIPNYPPISEIAIGAFPGIDKKMGDSVDFGESNITGEMKSTNLGIGANAGIRYNHNRYYFFMEIGGKYGLFTAQDDNTNGSNRLGAISVMVGCAFSLF